MLLSVTGMLVDLFCNNYASDCFCCSYAVRGSAAHMQVTVSVANMWVTIFIEVSVAIMQVVFSAVHCAHDCVYCNYGGDFPLLL